MTGVSIHILHCKKNKAQRVPKVTQLVNTDEFLLFYSFSFAKLLCKDQERLTGRLLIFLVLLKHYWPRKIHDVVLPILSQSGENESFFYRHERYFISWN